MSDPPDERKRKHGHRWPRNVAQSAWSPETPMQAQAMDAPDIAEAMQAVEMNDLPEAESPAVEMNDLPEAESPAVEMDDLPEAAVEAEEPEQSIDEPLATGVPALSPDTHDGDDCLGVEQEARAFARIICSRRTGTPLSVGLFGDWGSGKSFFMGLMQREIEARGRAFERVARRLDEADSPAARTLLDERWHGRVAQITFNAWHYAEPNLWASLVTRVFDELATQLNPEESVQDTRARLFAEVSEGRQRREQASLELREAELQLAEARAEQERCEADLTALRDELAVVEVVAPASPIPPVDGTKPPGAEGGPPPGTDGRPSPGADGRPSPGAEGRPPPAADRLRVDGPLAKLRVTLRWVWSRGRWTRVALVLGVLLVIAGVVLSLAWWRQWASLSPEVALATSGLGVAACVLSTLSAWMGLIRPRLESAKKAHQTLASGRTAARGFLQRAVRDLLKAGEDPARLARRRLEAAQAELESATSARDEAADQIARARRELLQLQGGRRFYDFIGDRDRSEDYRQHLGLVSLIREDFSRLEQILAQIEDEGPGDDRPAPVSRIVLYIDDLDRCEPERVVEVLQAVHLLLATPIFVVVVAVDVRWLRRSLTLHYDRLLQTSPEGGAPEPEDEARPTPKNYLEKIFQIPFSLRPMGPEGFASLVGSLARAGQQPPDAPRRSTAPSSDLSPSEDDTDRERQLAEDQVVALDAQEVAFLQSLHEVIDTPRLAKSLINAYRLLRAELPAHQLPDFLDSADYRSVATLLAIQVGRAPEATVLFEALHEPGASTLGEVVHRLSASAHEPDDRWADLLTALERIGVHTLPLRRLLPWVDQVRRFSFNPWPTR